MEVCALYCCRQARHAATAPVEGQHGGGEEQTQGKLHRCQQARALQDTASRHHLAGTDSGSGRGSDWAPDHRADKARGR